MKHTKKTLNAPTTKLRNLAILSIGLLLFIVILNAVFGLFRYPLLNISAFEAVPKHSTIVLQAELFEQSDTVVNSYLQVLKASPLQELAKDRAMFQYLLKDSIFHSNELPVLVSFQQVGATKLDHLYIIDSRKMKLDLPRIEEVFSKANHRKYNYQGQFYQSIKLKQGGQVFLFNYRNLWLLSRNPILIEDGIRQLGDYQNNLCKQANFKSLSNKAKSGNMLYINFNKLPDFFKAFCKYEYQDMFKVLPHVASWVKLDLDHKKWSGQFQSPFNFLKKKEQQSVQQSNLLKVIPDNTGLLLLQQNIPYDKKQDSIFVNTIKPWLAGEWAVNVFNPRTTADQLLILKAKDKLYAKHYLGRYAKLNGLLQTTTYQTFPIIQLMDNDLLQPYSTFLHSTFQNPFYTIIEDKVVFAKSLQSLEVLIDKYIVGQTIFKNENFLKYLNESDQHADGLLYIDGAAMIAFFERILNKEIQPQAKALLTQNIHPLKGGLNIYNGKKNNKSSFQMLWNESQEKNKGTTIVWRAALPAKVVGQPQPIWNKERAVYEILVQDAANRLYLLDANGEILWKRSLKNPILSEIYEIDYHEDGNLKLLFNTAHDIYLLDHTGKNIGNYPLHLQSPATNGLCLVDFKKDKKYQFFIACKNGHAYGFTKEGNPVFGWNPRKNVGEVVQTFQHFQYKSKDHLVVLDTHGELATYNSEGRRIIRKMVLGRNYRNSPEILQMGKRKVIALADEQGRLQIINNRGDAYQMKLEGGEGTPVKLAFANVVGDGGKDFVALNKNKLVYYSKDRKKLKQHFEVALQNEQDEVFEVLWPKARHSFIGTLCKSKQEINLFNNQNALHPDFPLAGTTPFSMIDLYKNDKKVLIVGFENAVYAYYVASQSHIK